MAVSSDSITQSVPSRTALLTSVTSARVGRRFSVIDSSIWVAVITGRPTALARLMRSFCATATRSMGISTPRSPRATMRPSQTSRMASICSTAWERSILATMKGACPRATAASRTARTSSGPCTNDTATASTPSRQGEGQQLPIALGEGGDAQVDAREAHSVARAQLAAHDHAGRRLLGARPRPAGATG